MPRRSSALQPTLTSSVFLLLIAFGSAPFSSLISNASAQVLAPNASAQVANTPGPVPTTVTTTPSTVKTTQPTTVQTAPVTTKVQKPDRLCAFPFWYRGGWQHECLEYGTKGARWCSLTQNFTKDEMWQECSRYDLMRYKCTVPFHYQGKAYNSCQILGLEPQAQPTFWCSLVPSVNEITWAGLGTDWVFCEAPNATDSVYLKTVGQHRCLEDALAVTTLMVPKPETTAPVVTTAVPATPKATAGSSVTSGIQGNPAGAQKSISAASADGAVAAASADGAPASSAGASSPGSGLGIVLGVVGVVLTTVAVAAAFIVHRRHQYKRIDPLLSSEPVVEKSSYGGMQAYHD